MKEEPYSRIGGIATKDEAYRLLNHHLDEAINQCHVIGHLHNTEDDHMSKLLAKGWHGVAQMLTMMKEQVRQIIMGKLQ